MITTKAAASDDAATDNTSVAVPPGTGPISSVQTSFPAQQQNYAVNNRTLAGFSESNIMVFANT